MTIASRVCMCICAVQLVIAIVMLHIHGVCMEKDNTIDLSKFHNCQLKGVGNLLESTKHNTWG